MGPAFLFLRRDYHLTAAALVGIPKRPGMVFVLMQTVK